MTLIWIDTHGTLEEGSEQVMTLIRIDTHSTLEEGSAILYCKLNVLSNVHRTVHLL